MKDKRNSQATGLFITAGKLTNIYVYFYVRTFFFKKVIATYRIVVLTLKSNDGEKYLITNNCH